jgi:hypothetical protein
MRGVQERPPGLRYSNGIVTVEEEAHLRAWLTTLDLEPVVMHGRLAQAGTALWSRLPLPGMDDITDGRDPCGAPRASRPDREHRRGGTRDLCRGAGDPVPHRCEHRLAPRCDFVRTRRGGSLTLRRCRDAVPAASKGRRASGLRATAGPAVGVCLVRIGARRVAAQRSTGETGTLVGDAPTAPPRLTHRGGWAPRPLDDALLDVAEHRASDQRLSGWPRLTVQSLAD